MDYERKYKEALGWMQSLYDGLHGATKEDAEHYFPELKESEDEQIRKDIIRVFKGEISYTSKDANEKYIAWLEKQAKKPADMVEPKDYSSVDPHFFKPTWSEEDERIRQCLIRDQEKALDDVCNDKYGHSEIISDLKEMYRERIDWLESLKQRLEGK